MLFLTKVVEAVFKFIDRGQQPEQHKLNTLLSENLSQSLYFNNNKNWELALRRIVKLRTACLVKAEELMKQNEKLFSYEIDFQKLFDQLFDKKVGEVFQIDIKSLVTKESIQNVNQLQTFIQNLFLYIEIYCEQLLRNSALSEEFSGYLKGELKYSLYQIIVSECLKQKPQVMKGLEFAFLGWLSSQDYSIRIEELRQKLNDPNVPNGMTKGLIEKTTQELNTRLKNCLERSQNFQIGDIFLYHYQEQVYQKLRGIVTIQVHKRYQCSEDKQMALKSSCYKILQALLETKSETKELIQPEILQNLQLIVLYAVDLVEFPHLVYVFYDLIKALGVTDWFYDDFNAFPLKHKQFREEKEHQCKMAINWWKINISKDINLTVMINLYLLTGGIQFLLTKDGKQLQGYNPEKKLMLTLIYRHLNDGQFGCLNYEVLRACERISGQIIIAVVRSLKQSQLMLGYIQVENQLLKLQIGTAQTKQIDLQERYQLFYQLFDKKTLGIDQGNINERELQKDLLIGIAKKHNFTGVFPKYFSFQLLSKPENASNVLTICITGFTTQEDLDYENKWSPLLANSTVIALRWGSGTIFGQGIQIMKQIYNLFAQKMFDKLYFRKAFDEATEVGQFLGFLIGQCNIFKDCQINLVGHSLGTLIIDQCIKMLDKQYRQDSVIHINSVVLLGGVADVRRLARNRWHSVGGHIYNLYSNKDTVLNYLLWGAKYYQKPCGLQEISHIYRKIVNYDTSDFVDGHSKYFKHLEKILMLTDFDNDCKFYYNDIY